jgi:hypothetical protein
MNAYKKIKLIKFAMFIFGLFFITFSVNIKYNDKLIKFF